MGFILNLIQKNSKLLLAVFLLLFSFILTLNRNVYHASTFNALVLNIRSNINSKIAKTTYFFNLYKNNEELIEENRKLKQILFNKQNIKKKQISYIVNSPKYKQQYTLISAKVIENSINLQNNFITLDKGLRSGISNDMGIITSNGVVGIVTNVTPNYATAISILHTRTKINARIKKKTYFGTLIWKAEDPRILHLIDIPKFVNLSIGDSIETDGKSSLFPEGIQLGKIAAFQLDKKTGNWDISVEIYQNMSKISNVFIVKNIATKELSVLKEQYIEENHAQ